MSPAAGWYPDPQNPAAQRYWDGAAWTSHTAPAAQPTYPAAQPTYPAAQPTYPATPTYQAAPSYSAGAAPAHGYAATAGAPTLSVGFGQAIKRAFHRWTNYRDRATLAEYWWFYLFTAIVMFVAYLPFLVAIGILTASSTQTVVTGADGITSTNLDVSGAGITALVIAGIIFFVLLLVLFFPQLAVTVRRLHDTDRSGWWILISFIPFGGLVLLIFLVLSGTPGSNRYGPPVTA